MKRNKKILPIPNFKSIQEEADFWDTHSVAPYWNQWKKVKIEVAKNLSSGLTVRFDERDLGRIRSQARSVGVGPTTLIRMWVLEKLSKSAVATN